LGGHAGSLGHHRWVCRRHVDARNRRFL